MVEDDTLHHTDVHAYTLNYSDAQKGIFHCFEDFTTALKIKSSKSYYSTES